MVDLDELDRLHAALPELCDRVTENAWSPTVFAVIAETPVTPRAGIVMGKAATNAIAILNAWPEVSRELRERRALGDAGVGAGMVDLDELDRVYRAGTQGHWGIRSLSVVQGEVVQSADNPCIAGLELRADALAITELHNAWPAISHELRVRRAGQKCGDMPTCRYRPAEVTFDGKTVTVMNSRDAHVLADMVAELAALRALAAVVKARCRMAHPEWAPEIREALAAVEKAKAP